MMLVNTTTSTMPIDAREIQPGSRVLEIAFYETDFLKPAREKHCKCLDGFAMYFQQAAAQQAIFWI
jgi:shikimate 5-dehydrogenase